MFTKYGDIMTVLEFPLCFKVIGHFYFRGGIGKGSMKETDFIVKSRALDTYIHTFGGVLYDFLTYMGSEIHVSRHVLIKRKKNKSLESFKWLCSHFTFELHM